MRIATLILILSGLTAWPQPMSLRSLPPIGALRPARVTYFPTNLPDCVLWLAPEGLPASGLVTNWADLSTNAWNATNYTAATAAYATNNQVNGHPAAKFDGIDDYLRVSGNGVMMLSNVAGATLFVLHSYVSNGANQCFFEATRGDSASSARLYHYVGAGGFVGAGGRRLDTDSFVSDSTPMKKDGGFWVSYIRADYSTATLKAYSNSVPMFTNASWMTAGQSMSNASVNVNIGGIPGSAGSFNSNYIADLVVFNSVLSESNAAYLWTNYFQRKYGL